MNFEICRQIKGGLLTLLAKGALALLFNAIASDSTDHTSII